MNRALRAILVLGVLPLCGACGYRLMNEAAVFGPDVREIRLRVFENQSNEPGLERVVIDAIHEEFLRGGTLAPTYEPGAPLELQGVIRRVEVTASALDSVGLALENVVRLVVDVSVERSGTGESVWSASDLVEIERFSASADSNVHETAKRQALRRLSAVLASRIRDELFQTF